MKDISSILKSQTFQNKKKHTHSIYQIYADKLASYFNDKKNFKLYIGLIFNNDWKVLQEAFDFVKDTPSAKNPKALFLWKIKQIKMEKENFEKVDAIITK